MVPRQMRRQGQVQIIFRIECAGSEGSDCGNDDDTLRLLGSTRKFFGKSCLLHLFFLPYLYKLARERSRLCYEVSTACIESGICPTHDVFFPQTPKQLNKRNTLILRTACRKDDNNPKKVPLPNESTLVVRRSYAKGVGSDGRQDQLGRPVCRGSRRAFATVLNQSSLDLVRQTSASCSTIGCVLQARSRRQAFRRSMSPFGTRHVSSV